MIITHNMMAINVRGQFGLVSGKRKKTAEKLSSGYRINRAGDDAAGLAVSENMRRQIQGLNQGVQNTRDGISLCQVADGALTEVSSMLQRINTLSMQSANGVYSDEERNGIQEEVSQLKQEIDRICNHTEFGGIKIFKGLRVELPVQELTDDEIFRILVEGNFRAGAEDITLEDGQTLKAYYADAALKGMSSLAKVYEAYDKKYTIDEATLSVNRASIEKMLNTINEYALPFSEEIQNADDKKYFQEEFAYAKHTTTEYLDETKSVEEMIRFVGGREVPDIYNSVTGAYQSALHYIDAGDASKGWNRQLAGFMAEGLVHAAASVNKPTANGQPDRLVYAAESFAKATKAAIYQSGIRKGELMHLADDLVTKSGLGYDLSEAKSAAISMYRYLFPPEKNSEGIWIQCAAEALEGMVVGVERMDVQILGIEDLNVSTQEGASEAIGILDGALQVLSGSRGRIGASQNRLEHTLNNLNNTLENITAAESRIRDTDVAEEMVKYTKEQILLQTGQAMLAQANTLGQNVLVLLGI